MDWLAHPPDMNLIEHVRRRITASNVQCGMRESLELELVDDGA